MSNIKFIVYQTHIDYPEVLVTTPELEQEFLNEWFGDGNERYLGDYDRTEHDETGILVRNRGLKVM
jgi:hypothetical protein